MSRLMTLVFVAMTTLAVSGIAFAADAAQAQPVFVDWAKVIFVLHQSLQRVSAWGSVQSAPVRVWEQH